MAAGLKMDQKVGKYPHIRLDHIQYFVAKDRLLCALRSFRNHFGTVVLLIRQQPVRVGPFILRDLPADHCLVAFVDLPVLHQIRQLCRCLFGLCQKQDPRHRPVQTVDHRQIRFFVRIPAIEHVVFHDTDHVLTIRVVGLGGNTVRLYHRDHVFVFVDDVWFHEILRPDYTFQSTGFFASLRMTG